MEEKILTKKEVIENLEKDGLLLENYPSKFKKDYDCALVAITNNPKAFLFVDSYTINYKYLLIDAVKLDPTLLDSISIYSIDKDVRNQIVMNNPDLFFKFDFYRDQLEVIFFLDRSLLLRMDYDLLRSHPNFIKNIFYQNISCYFPEKIRNDGDLIRNLALDNIKIFEKLASDELKGNIEYLKTYEKVIVELEKFLPKKLIESEEYFYFLLDLTKNNIYLKLRHIPNSVYNDRDLFLKLMNDYQINLVVPLINSVYFPEKQKEKEDECLIPEREDYISDYNEMYDLYEIGRFKKGTEPNGKIPLTKEIEAILDDESIILKSIESKRYSFCGIYNFISERLLSDEEFFRKSIRCNTGLYRKFSEKIKNDKNLAKFAIENQISYSVFSDELKNDRSFLLFALQNSFYNNPLEYVNEKFLNDKEVAKIALEKSFKSMRYLNKEILLEKEILKYILDNCPSSLIDDIPDEILSEEEKFVLIIKKSEFHEMKNYNFYFEDKLKDNKELLLIILGYIQNGYISTFENLSKISTRLLGDEDIVNLLITHGYKNFSLASEELKNNKNYILQAIEIDVRILEYTYERIIADEGIIKKAISYDGRALLYADEKFLLDRDIIIEAVNNHFPIHKIPIFLKNDKEFIMKILKSIKFAYAIVGNDLLDDYDIGMLMVTCLDEAYKRLSDNLQKNKEIAIEAIRNFYTAFKYFPQELKNDEDFLGELIKIDYRVIKYFGVDFYKNHDFVKILIINYPNCYKYLPEKYRLSEDVISIALNSGYSLDFNCNLINTNKELILLSISNGNYNLRFTTDEIKRNKEIVMKAVTKNGMVLEHASNELKDDEEVVILAISQNGRALEYASSRLKNNFNFYETALKHSNRLFRTKMHFYFEKYLEENFGCISDLKHDEKKSKILEKKEFVKDLVQLDGKLLEYFEDFKNDQEVVEMALQNNPNAIRYCSEEFRKNKDLAIKLIRRKPKIIKSISDELRKDIDCVKEAIRIDKQMIEFTIPKYKCDKEILNILNS